MVTTPSGRYRTLRAFALLLTFTCAAVTAGGQTLHDLEGSWRGDWGEVVLEKIGPVSYVGTYSDTFGKDTGRLTFSFVAGNYEGKWWEGTYRLGEITLHVSRDGRTLTGTWSASPASTIQPGSPRHATLRWTRK